MRQLLAGFEGNLARLHSQAESGVGLGALRNPCAVARAFAVWGDGRTALHGFHPISAPTIIVVHSIVDLAFVATLVWLGRRLCGLLDLGGWPANLLVAGGSVKVVNDSLDILSALDAGSRHSAAEILRVTFYAEWSFFGLAAIIALPGLIGAIGRVIGYLFDTSAVARIAVAASVGFVAVLFLNGIGSQSEDALALWLEGRWWLGLATLVAAAIYVGVIWILQHIPPTGGQPARPFVLTFVGLAFFAVGLWWRSLSYGGSGLLVFGVLFVLLGLGSYAAGQKWPDQPAEPSSRPAFVAAGVLPLAGIAIVEVRLLASAIATHGRWELTAGVAYVALCTALGAGLLLAWQPSLHPSPDPPDWSVDSTPVSSRVRDFVRGRGWALGLFAPCIVAVAVAARWQAPFTQLGTDVGSIAVVLLGLSLLGTLVGGLRVVWERADAPAGLRALGFTRTPVVTLAVLCVVVASSLDSRATDVRYHALQAVTRVVSPGPVKSDAAVCTTARSGPQGEVGDQFCRWLNRVAKDHQGTTVPLVLVTASGGGIRAAAWTARVLDCLFLPAPTQGADPCGEAARPIGQADRWQNVFAAGGASGGSVGIASTVAEELSRPDPAPPRDWVRESLQNDFLSPMLAYDVLGETPRDLLSVHVGDDRAAVLVGQWSAQWGRISSRCPKLAGTSIANAGFLTIMNACSDAPLMLFNGTNVADGERVNISPLDGAGIAKAESRLRNAAGEAIPKDAAFSPFSHDVRDVLCPDQDIRLFDAAFLSSRFPIVSPSGHLPPRGVGNDNCMPSSTRTLDVVDGGYRDNSGASQIEELWQVLAPLITQHNLKPGRYATVRPVILEIDNGEGSSIPGLSTGGAGAQLLRPVETALHLLLDRGPEYRDRLKVDVNAFDQPPTPKPVLFTLKLEEHPGGRLPLGWMLSRDALDDVDTQFTLDLTKQTSAAFGDQFGS